MNHCYLNKGFGTLDCLLIVFGQTARAIEPSEGAFHDPAFRLHDKALLAFGSADDFQGPDPQDPSPRDHSPIGGINPNHFGEFHLLAKCGECFFSAFGILHRPGGDYQCPDQAERINHNMPLAAGDFFFPRRSLSARLAPWFSRSGCPEWQPWALAFCLRAAGHGSVIDRECGPRLHPFANSGSNGTHYGMVAGRGASRATLRRYALDIVSHSRFHGACTLRAVRRVLAGAPTSEWQSIARPSGRSGKTSLSWGQG